MRSTPYLCFFLPVICGGCRTAAAEVPVVERADAGVFIESALIESAIVAPTSTTSEPVSPAACPTGMVLVEGDYCPDVEQRCLEWMDPPGPYQFFRCKRYAEPAGCKSKKRVHERFCIDETERTEVGSDVPLNHQSWSTSKKLCESSGARLCLTREWVFACEGEEMRPYPYGWTRDSSVCNADIDHGLGRIGHLVDHRTPASAHPLCLSAFGIHDMAGNVDEWTTIDGAPRGAREVMHGSWWMPGRNSCRSFQGGHGASYEGTESGTRCCADAE
jgi:sulfatase modifying factor 1